MMYPVFVRKWMSRTTVCAGAIEWSTIDGPWLTITKHWTSVGGIASKMQFQLRRETETGACFLFGSCPDEELDHVIEAIRRLGSTEEKKPPPKKESRYVRKVINAVDEYLGYERVNGPLGVHGEKSRDDLIALLLGTRPSEQLAGAIAYALTKRLVIDISTARAAVDEAIKRMKESV